MGRGVHWGEGRRTSEPQATELELRCQKSISLGYLTFFEGAEASPLPGFHPSLRPSPLACTGALRSCLAQPTYPSPLPHPLDLLLHALPQPEHLHTVVVAFQLTLESTI